MLWHIIRTTKEGLRVQVHPVQSSPSPKFNTTHHIFNKAQPQTESPRITVIKS